MRLAGVPAVLALLALAACGADSGPYVVSSWQRELGRGRQALEEKRYADAEALYRRVLQDPSRFDGDPVLLAQTLNNLASSLKGQSKFGQAEPLYRRALDLLEASKTARQSDIAVVADNYGSMLAAADRQRDVDELKRRVALYFQSRPVGSAAAGMGDAKDGTWEEGAKPRQGAPSLGRSGGGS